MKLPRRAFLHLAAGAAALPTLPRFARAQAYPDRPVRWIVGLAAGGGASILAQLMSQWMSEQLGQPFVKAAAGCLCHHVLAQRRQKMLRGFHIGGIQAFGEPREYRLQQRAGIVSPSLRSHKLCEVDRRAQLVGTRALLTADFN